MTQAKERSRGVITRTQDGNVIVFTVSDIGSLSLDLSKIAEANRLKAIAHGFGQRIQDAAAIGYNAQENRYATPQEKFDAMKQLVEHYNSGAAEWSPVRGDSAPRSSFLLTALCELFADKTADELRERIAKLSPADRRKVENSDKVKPIIDRLRAATHDEAAEKKAEELLGEIGL